MVDVGVIGAGGIATVHLETLSNIPAVDVCAIADIDDERAGTAATEYEAVAYTDGIELLESESLDVLFVTVPPFARTTFERRAAECGIDLFVEKPVGLDLERARRTERVIDETGVLADVGYVCRHAEITDRARSILEGRTIGLLCSRYAVNVPDVPWWREREKSGGQLVEQATHVYDVHRLLAGDVDSVRGVSTDRRLVTEIDFADASTVAMTHESGSISQVTATSAALSPQFTVTVFASGAQLTLDFFEHTIVGVVDGERIEYDGANDWYQREVENFVAAVEDRDESRLRSPYPDAVETLELTLAARDSLESDGVIRLG